MPATHLGRLLCFTHDGAKFIGDYFEDRYGNPWVSTTDPENDEDGNSFVEGLWLDPTDIAPCEGPSTATHACRTRLNPADATLFYL